MTTTMGGCGDGQLDNGEECDDGAQAPGDGCAPDCTKEFRRVFVTSEVFTGNLGGVAGADQKCQDAAEQAGLPGIYKAWLSTPSASPSGWLVQSAMPYQQVDGVVVATGWTDLTDGSLLNGSYVSESGGPPGVGIHSCLPDERPVWTNTQTLGTSYTSDRHCTEWSGSGMAFAGHAGAVTSNWTVGCEIKCGDEAALYCFEQ